MWVTSTARPSETVAPAWARPVVRAAHAGAVSQPASTSATPSVSSRTYTSTYRRVFWGSGTGIDQSPGRTRSTGGSTSANHASRCRLPVTSTIIAPYPPGPAGNEGRGGGHGLDPGHGGQRIRTYVRSRSRGRPERGRHGPRAPAAP